MACDTDAAGDAGATLLPDSALLEPVHRRLDQRAHRAQLAALGRGADELDHRRAHCVIRSCANSAARTSRSMTAIASGGNSSWISAFGVEQCERLSQSSASTIEHGEKYSTSPNRGGRPASTKSGTYAMSRPQQLKSLSVTIASISGNAPTT
jgi:hypothetical protein